MVDMKAVADGADLIVNGYAFTNLDGKINVVNINHSDSVASLDLQGRLLCTTMPDIEVGIIRRLYQLNHDLMEA